jgi:hypothetical protein
MRLDSCTGAWRETGNWRVEVAGRLRNPCRNRVVRDAAYYAAVSSRRVKPRTERLALRSCGHSVKATARRAAALWSSHDSVVPVRCSKSASRCSRSAISRTFIQLRQSVVPKRCSNTWNLTSIWTPCWLGRGIRCTPPSAQRIADPARRRDRRPHRRSHRGAIRHRRSHRGAVHLHRRKPAARIALTISVSTGQ